MIYGHLPQDLGPIELDTSEMMFWLYCPIKTPESLTTLPPNLHKFLPLVHAVMDSDPDRYFDEYVYLTAKTLWATPSNPGNRPGWHSDGFGSNDLNFVWYDDSPTEFIQSSFELPDNCEDAMKEMAAKLNAIDREGYSHAEGLPLKWAIIEAEPDADARYGGAVWITYQ